MDDLGICDEYRFDDLVCCLTNDRIKMDYAQQILDKTDGGLYVFNYYMPFEFVPKKRFRNPFYDDTRASCYIYFNKERERYYMKDHGDPTYSGDCFWFVGLMLKIDCKTNFMEILKRINHDLNLFLKLEEADGDFSPSVSPMRKLPSKKEEDVVAERKVKPKRFAISKRDMSPEDLKYWGRYGITKCILEKYNVFSLNSFSSENENGPYVITNHPNRYMFAYKQDSFVKIYRPMEQYRFLYGGDKPRNYCFGLKQLPASGDMVFITGGEKDVLSLASHGFNAVCFNSETTDFPTDVMDVLKERFRNIIILYDCDDTGKASMSKQKELWNNYNVLTVLLPLSGTKEDKDISDFFRKGKTSQQLRDYVGRIITASIEESMLLLSSCEMDFSNPPVESEHVVTVNGVPIASCGNLTCITGGEGTGKSHLVSALLAGALLKEEPTKEIDLLGFEVSPNRLGKAVIHFDTEQSEQQLFNNTMIMKKRAGLVELPKFYHSYYYATYNRGLRLKGIKDAMSFFYHKHGGVYMVVIDGVADLLESTNDEKNSIKVVEELYKLACCYHACVICVLHFVPNGIKLRGHLGSEMQRKSSSILSVEKDDNSSCSVIKVVKLREANPLEVPMQQFSWDKESDMPTYAGAKSAAATANRKKEILEQIVNNIYSTGNECYTYTELVRRVEEEADVRDRTAKTYISELYNSKTIVKRGDLYVANIRKGEDKCM